VNGEGSVEFVDLGDDLLRLSTKERNLLRECICDGNGALMRAILEARERYEWTKLSLGIQVIRDLVNDTAIKSDGEFSR
jgi:hypothetical protein